LLDEYRAQLPPQDIRVAEHLCAWVPSNRSTYPVHALLALVGHPRLIDSHEQPIELARAPLGFTALPSGDHIRLEPSREGARMPPKLLGALLQTFAPGEPLVVDGGDDHRIVLVDVSDEALAMWQALVQHGDTFPPESHAGLLERLGKIEARL